MKPTEGPRHRWRRWAAVGTGALLVLSAGLAWQWCPLPTARWRVVEISVEGKRVDPMGSFVTTSMANVTFHGCNEMGASVGGLPWRPRLVATWSTVVGCTGAREDLDQIWHRLTRSAITFDGAWRTTATLRGGPVTISLDRS